MRCYLCLCRCFCLCFCCLSCATSVYSFALATDAYGFAPAVLNQIPSELILLRRRFRHYRTCDQTSQILSPTAENLSAITNDLGIIRSLFSYRRAQNDVNNHLIRQASKKMSCSRFISPIFSPQRALRR